MATHTCNQNCGCNNTYTVTPPCPPACPEVFNSQCIVYTGTDIMCNTDTVIKRYDYLDTVITKLVNYICTVQAPITEVVGSTYIDVVPNTVGNVTTYTVSADIPALQAYFENVLAQDIAASVLAGPGIDVAVNPVTNTVTVSHEDTSSVASPLVSDNSGNSFIQDIAFTFDTYGHVTGASVVPGTVTPPNDYNKAQVYPDSLSFTWGPNNDPTNIQEALLPGDTLNFVAGAGIILNASTVTSTDAIRITNSDPGSAVTLTSAGGTQTLVNDGVGPALATKGLTAGNGITLTASSNAVTIIANVNRDDTSVTAQVIALATPYNLTHTLGKQFVSLTIIDTATQGDVTSRFTIIYSGVGTYIIQENNGFTGTVRVLAIG